VRVFLWWFAVFAAYVITVGAQNGGEIVAGALIAVPCIALVLRAFDHASPGVRVRWRWLKHLAGVPARMLSDALIVSRRIVWALASREKLAGYFIRIPYHPGDRSGDWNMGREALAIYGISASPNSLVTEVDMRGELVLHKLVAAEQPAESPEWPL
jgi:hypothetical protein